MSSQHKPVLVIGGGGHAKVVIDMLENRGRTIIGIVDPGIQPGEKVMGIPVLGDDSVVTHYDPKEIYLANGIGSLPGKIFRWQTADRFRKSGYSFATIVHPSACIGSEVNIDHGVQIMAGCVIQPGVGVGRDTIINTGATIDHDCQIGPYCHIAPGVTLSGGVRVGKRVHIGTGATIIQQITISDGATIRAGSLISSDMKIE